MVLAASKISVKRRFRLSKATDFERVRREGKSFAHPLIVLIVKQNDLDHSRFAVAAGRSVGNAVQRNRAKRRLRAAIRTLVPRLEPGWDAVILARHPLSQAFFQDLQEALQSCFQRARILKDFHEE